MVGKTEAIIGNGNGVRAEKMAATTSEKGLEKKKDMRRGGKDAGNKGFE